MLIGVAIHILCAGAPIAIALAARRFLLKSSDRRRKS
jgi:hypothetical protein